MSVRADIFAHLGFVKGVLKGRIEGLNGGDLEPERQALTELQAVIDALRTQALSSVTAAGDSGLNITQEDMHAAAIESSADLLECAKGTVFEEAARKVYDDYRATPNGGDAARE